MKIVCSDLAEESPGPATLRRPASRLGLTQSSYISPGDARTAFPSPGSPGPSASRRPASLGARETLGRLQKTVKSEQWQAVLKARGWADYYAPSDEFQTFIGSETARVHDVLKSIGLAN